MSIAAGVADSFASSGWRPSDGIYDGGLPIEEIFGLPVHPLVVHAVVALLPLAALGLILTASSHSRSRRHGGVLVVLAGAAAIAAVLAVLSGRTLAEQLGYGAQQHFVIGGWIPWVGLALFVCALLLWLIDRKAPSRGLPGKAVAVAAVLVAAGAIGATIYAGHLGAELTWAQRT